MKKYALLLLTCVSVSTFATEQTVTLAVPTMNCAACPVTVKKALQNVDGVRQAEVSYATKQAVVTFDDEKTTPARLVEVTTNAGYPSTVKKP